MGAITTAPRHGPPGGGFCRACRLLLAALFCSATLSGCFLHRFALFKPEAPPPPADSLVLGADGLRPEQAPAKDSPEADLIGARELFRQKEYSRAEHLFHYLAENTKNPAPLAAEARYYEAECLRMQGYYPTAADTYADLLNRFPNNPYKEQAIEHMFEIADFWLKDTREEMKESEEVRKGKRWFVWPRFVSFDRTKPVLDREGRALEKLEQVHWRGGDTPLSDKALFLAGSVKMYREDFREADRYFSEIHERHPNSPLAPKAVELAIQAKHLSTGGSDYDSRKAAEARKLIQSAMNNYPELARDKREFLSDQVARIDFQQAEKDYKIAEFYKRTGHPASAYFYYELVARRYPYTKYAQLAAEKRDAIKEKADREKLEKGIGPSTPAPGAAARPATPPRAELLPPPRQPNAQSTPQPGTPPSQGAPGTVPPGGGPPGG
jgi:outer membrane protein assembly factor BamD (BamD/ComL family)